MNTTTVMSSNTDLYKYTASVTFIDGSDVYDLETVNIRTIAIDYNYNDLNMPMIFMTLGIYKSLANKMIMKQDSAIFILNIKRAITNSDMPNLYSDYINDKFIYFITGDIDEGTLVELKEDAPDDDTTVTVGLLCQDHVNKNKKPVNGIIKGNLSSAMYYLTGHLPIVIEPPTSNIALENKIIPPLNSVAKSIEYLNSIHVLYNTPYRFFIDFDQAYLISSSGNGVKVRGDNINTVLITILHEDEYDAKIQGMTTNKSQELYDVLVSHKDCQLCDNTLSNKSFSKVTATNTSGNSTNATSATKSSSSNVTSKTRTIRVSNDNDGLLQNMVTKMDQSAIQILVQKTDVDAAAFTMNREYIIRAEEAYNTDAYNGRYLLVRKRELYIRDDDTFTVNVMLLLEKVPG